MNNIIEVLMRRDNISRIEASELIKEAQEAFSEYLAEGDIASAEEICGEFFGLEPDYIGILF